ncbi:hypothetical protein [Fodinibius salsisoli]|uniref:Uncharacterized protein n=1 Tax=Fodinibius salsisoli TaxID=2820877 RepID=A0ABT3PIK9_9BACT|nr:hypothetical protein [Fodinibius salsisoli]MCW9705770.1 hypothetical protein [Fodinibius salsisoli]
MKDYKAKKLVRTLRDTGLSFQGDGALRISLSFKDQSDDDLLDSLKQFEASKNTNLTDNDLFDIYQTIATLHKVDSNKFQNLLYQIRSLKYKPSAQSVKQDYLSDFLEFTKQKRDEFTREEIECLLKEFFRFNKFIEMKWGRENEVFKLSQQILDELEAYDASNRNMKNEELSKFIESFREVNRKYRPDKQALDYASQIIYEQYNTYELDS